MSDTSETDGGAGGYDDTLFLINNLATRQSRAPTVPGVAYVLKNCLRELMLMASPSGNGKISYAASWVGFFYDTSLAVSLRSNARRFGRSDFPEART